MLVRLSGVEPYLKSAHGDASAAGILSPSALAIAGRAAPWVDADRPEPVIEFIRTLGMGEAEEVDATDDATADLEAWA